MFSKKELLLDSLVTSLWNYLEKNNTYDFWDEESNNSDIVQQLVDVIDNNLKVVKITSLKKKIPYVIQKLNLAYSNKSN